MTLFSVRPIFALAFAAFGFAGFAVAQSYPPGHQALELWDAAGRASAPGWVQVWLGIMTATFLAGLLFVWRRIEARWVVGGILLMIPANYVLESVVGLMALSGLAALMHLIFWSPGLYVLLRRRTFLKERSVYAAWTGLVTFVILFSFVFDIRDAAIYITHSLENGVVMAS